MIDYLADICMYAVTLKDDHGNVDWIGPRMKDAENNAQVIEVLDKSGVKYSITVARVD
jgi:hypothetical protein